MLIVQRILRRVAESVWIDSLVPTLISAFFPRVEQLLLQLTVIHNFLTISLHLTCWCIQLERAQTRVNPRPNRALVLHYQAIYLGAAGRVLQIKEMRRAWITILVGAGRWSTEQLAHRKDWVEWALSTKLVPRNSGGFSKQRGHTSKLQWTQCHDLSANSPWNRIQIHMNCSATRWRTTVGIEVLR